MISRPFTPPAFRESGKDRDRGQTGSTKPKGITFRHSQVTIADSAIHVVETGDQRGAPVLFLHGWPESWYAWRSVMELASNSYRAMAIDLPGIGGSTCGSTDGSKRQLAEIVHELMERMRLKDVVLVGQDVGGMIAFSYLRQYDDLAGAVIMDVVIPGLDPWDEVLHNPYIWHFALHSVPHLPENLVQGRQGVYFDYFFNALSADPSLITPEARAAYVNAYSTDGSLTAGFNWYRAFATDAKSNTQPTDVPRKTPLLYLRGEHEPGDIGRYVRGLEGAGIEHVEHGIVPNAGHFTQEEAPHGVWQLIERFLGKR